MKKIISLILALVMAMSLAVTAMAANTHETSGIIGNVTIQVDESAAGTGAKLGDSWKFDIPATGSVVEFNKTIVDPTYYVVMTWDVTSNLTYTVNNTDYKWNVYNVAEDGAETQLNGTDEKTKTPTEARYDVEGKWNGEANIKVSVANWSNVDITATPAWASSDVATPENANGVTKKIEITGMPTAIAVDIGRADASVSKVGDKVNNIEAKEIYNAVIDNTGSSTDGSAKITDGAINNGSAIIGTLTVTIAKKATTPSA